MDKQKIQNALKDPEAVFFFVASSDLRSLIAIGSRAELQGLPLVFTKILLEGNGIKISHKMVKQYLDGTLDDRNRFILDRGEIRLLKDGSPVKLANEIIC